ncbi:CDP-alcohol phosphatidyltransferase family protein [Legionella sp. CNM-4043-24]|uniref:CDP-alcohol phosphatidyltransferase family protein n=1 Tax=Legionella sp. CNM-4043-24 TaxID=3421646 RepID=UPI00403ABF9E
MIEQYIRPTYQHYLVTPMVKRLSGHISPNHITLFSGLLGLLLIPALLWNHIYLAIALLLLSGYCDTLDGTLARLRNNVSDWGSALDIVTDRAVELSMVMALWLVAPQSRSLWCLLMLGSMLLCITSFLVVGIFTSNQSHKSFHYSSGLMERAEAFLFFIAMMLWPGAFSWLALGFVLLVTATALIRMNQFRLYSLR